MSNTSVSWIDHLADLRKRIIYVVIALVLVLIASLIFVSRLYHYFVTPLTRMHQHLIVVSPGEIITVFLSIAGVVSIGITLPFALYQLWKFVAPGLTQTERRYTVRLLPITFVMFIAGVCFAWFLIFPTILHFLVRLTSQQGLQMFLRADAYFSFLTSICLPFGFIFELPIVVAFLTRIGLLTPTKLRKVRRFAYLIIVVLGVLISPPELISHLSVTVPMMVLYELSILISAMVFKRRNRETPAA